MTAQLKAVPEPETPPRGEAASESQIALYALLFQNPLTFDEIVARLPSSFRSHAYEEFKADQRSQNIPIRDDDWTREESDAAWRWWVGQLVDLSRISKRLIATAADGGRATGKRRHQLIYKANPDLKKAPMVHRRIVTDKLERWTPEYGNVGRKHAATMQTVADVRKLLKTTKDDDLRSLLERVIEAMKP